MFLSDGLSASQYINPYNFSARNMDIVPDDQGKASPTAITLHSFFSPRFPPLLLSSSTSYPPLFVLSSLLFSPLIFFLFS